MTSIECPLSCLITFIYFYKLIELKCVRTVQYESIFVGFWAGLVLGVQHLILQMKLLDAILKLSSEIVNVFKSYI